MSDQRIYWEDGGAYRSTDHPVVTLFARQRVAHLRKRGALAGVRSFLDVGAGSGFSSIHYPPEIRVVACDYARGMISTNPTRQRVRSAADRLPFEDRSFDAVSCWELLHHLEDPVGALREMWRVARKRVLVFEPNRIHPGHLFLGLTRKEERASLRFSPGHVRRLLTAAGYPPPRIHERCGSLFPNITPLPLARMIYALPFRLPVIGISQLVIAEKS